MSGPARVDLAHEQPFAIGRLTVRPATREVVRDDNAVEVLEPRVMQVLVALHRAGGAIVGRDDLTQSCWDGRVVGEDAINRVVSRLRRTASSIGEGAFRIETVTKVGYRLAGSAESALQAAPGGETRSVSAGSGFHPNRRWLAGGVLAVAAMGGGAWWRNKERHSPAGRPTHDPQVAALFQQANAADRMTREGQNQAIGLLRRAVTLRPDNAGAWGFLATIYASAAGSRSSVEGAMLRARASEAAHRALSIDPDDRQAKLALVVNRPMIGSWLEVERAVRQALPVSPDKVGLLLTLAAVLSNVGRNAEAATAQDQAAKLVDAPRPGMLYAQIQALWAAGRMEEADQVIAEATSLFPTYYAIWFSRFYVWMYSGRVTDAIAMGENRDGWPSSIPTIEMESVLRVAYALRSGRKTDVEAVLREQWARAHAAAGYAANAMQFACALGRPDQALAIAEAFYLSRGFEVPEVRYTREQGVYSPRRDRHALYLFLPSTASMRTLPGFARLLDDVGLTRYWALSGTMPDYRRRA